MSRDLDAVRSRGYRLLSRLYLQGLTAEDLPPLRKVPGLSGHLPDPFDPDEAAAEHHRLFQREVLPYASVFLETDGSLGGDVSSAVGRKIAAAGLPPPTSEAPDHLGRELELLGALEDDRLGSGAGADELLVFLDGHLLWWLPSLVAALGRNGTPFWCAVAELTLDLAVEHRSALAGTADPEPPIPWHLQGVPRNPVDDPTVDLREVATFLMLPARSGLYLSEADARSVGRSRGLPGGFGARARVLETLFHSAVAYQGMDDVTDGLVRVVDGVRGTLEGRVESGLLAVFAEPWLRRLERTRSMLGRMRTGEGPVS